MVPFVSYSFCVVVYKIRHRFHTWCGCEVPGMNLLRRRDRSKHVSAYFILHQLKISTHQRQLHGMCGADKTLVFCRLVAKMSDRFWEQRITI